MRVWVWLHATVVALLIVLFYVADASGPQTDANIGAGMIGLLLLGLGLPWSLVRLLIDTGTYLELSEPVRGLVDFGPAVLNVMLHAALRSRSGGRQSQGPRSQGR